MSNARQRLALLRGLNAEIHGQQAAQARARKARLLRTLELISTVALMVGAGLVIITMLSK